MEIFDTVALINKRGVTILIVEQNAMALSLANRAFVLEVGKIVLEGSAAELSVRREGEGGLPGR